MGVQSCDPLLKKEKEKPSSRAETLEALSLDNQ